MAVHDVSAPVAGFWRIGRGQDPLRVRRAERGEADISRVGNRFDSPDFGVLYFSSSLHGCFGETLARLRPSVPMLALVEDEWKEQNFMLVGTIPADWRFRRTAVHVTVDPAWHFLDVDHPATHDALRHTLATGLSALGYSDLDAALVRGPDRRVTRLIAQWAWVQAGADEEPLYGGIRYCSRLSDDWECWAVFEDVELEVHETRPITLDMPELEKICELFGLRPF